MDQIKLLLIIALLSLKVILITIVYIQRTTQIMKINKLKLRLTKIRRIRPQKKLLTKHRKVIMRTICDTLLNKDTMELM